MKVNHKNEEHRERVALIIGYIQRGYEGADLKKMIKDTCNITGASIDCFIAEARKMIKKDVEAAAQSLREQQLYRYLGMYREALDSGNLKTANNILANIDKLYSLQVQKVEQNGEIVIKFE